MISVEPQNQWFTSGSRVVPECAAHAVLLAPGLESKGAPDVLVFVFSAETNARSGKKGLL